MVFDAEEAQLRVLTLVVVILAEGEGQALGQLAGGAFAVLAAELGFEGGELELDGLCAASVSSKR